MVTGGAGFVGSNIAIRMRKRYPEARIVVADNLKRRGSAFNLPRLAAAGIDFVHADVRNDDDMAFPDDKFDLLIECSAEPSVLTGLGGRPRSAINTNLIGTVNCLEIARRCGSDLIFLSTSRVYPISTLEGIAVVEGTDRFDIAADQTVTGVSPEGISESFPLEGARSLYGATKLCSELLIEEYADMYDLHYVINRCGVIAGPWQMGKADQGVFTFWMGRHFFGQPLDYVGYGGFGKQVRDVISIEDLGTLIERQLENLGKLPHRLYNIGGGPASSLSLRQITAMCQEITANRVEIRSVVENRPLDVKIYITDNGRAQRDLAWAPMKSPRETLIDIYEWIRANEALLAPLWRS